MRWLRRLALSGWLAAAYIAFDFVYWRRRGGAFNHR